MVLKCLSFTEHYKLPIGFHNTSMAHCKAEMQIGIKAEYYNALWHLEGKRELILTSAVEFTKMYRH